MNFLKHLKWKDLIVPGLLALCVLIVYLYGLEERLHADEHMIPFEALNQPDDITCGPTCAAMILHHYGKRVTIGEVKDLTKTVWFTHNTHDVGMTSPDYLPIALSKLGVPAQMKYGNIDTLKHYVGQDRPCICLVRSGERLWHYVVVHGFTQTKVFIADPGGGELYDMDIDTFLGCWSFEKDMEGNPCGSSYLVTLLRAAEVYPYTFICPDRPKEKI